MHNNLIITSTIKFAEKKQEELAMISHHLSDKLTTNWVVCQNKLTTSLRQTHAKLLLIFAPPARTNLPRICTTGQDKLTSDSRHLPGKTYLGFAPLARTNLPRICATCQDKTMPVKSRYFM